MTFYKYSHGSAAKKQQQVPFNLALGGGGGGGGTPLKGVKQGIKNRNSVLNRVGKSAIFVLNRIRV